MMQQASFAFDQHNIAYRVSGSGDPAVFLHGFPTSAYDWEPIVAALEQDRQCWALDLLGFGLSDKPRPHRYSIFEQADLVMTFVISHRMQEVDLVCHDYGDTVGLELLARQHEGRLPFSIRSMTLLNGSVYFDLAQLRLIQRLLEMPTIGEFIARFITRDIFARQFSAIFSEHHPISEAELDKHWELLIHNDGRAVYPALIRYLSERREHATTRWEPPLENPGLPICAIWGMADPVAVGAMGERLRDRNPAATVHLLDGVGHYPQLEVPEAVITHIRAFWSSLDPAVP